MSVLVVARLCHSGRDEWKTKPIDRCIAPLVEALQKAGIRTLGSCCGHGDHPGVIALEDGRTLRVTHGEVQCDDHQLELNLSPEFKRMLDRNMERHAQLLDMLAKI